MLDPVMSTHPETPVRTYVLGAFPSLVALATAHPDPEPDAVAHIGGQAYAWSGRDWVHTGPLTIQRGPATQRQTGVHLRTLARWEDRGWFPRRIKIGPNATGHFSHEVGAWMSRRRAGTASAAERSPARYPRRGAPASDDTTTTPP